MFRRPERQPRSVGSVRPPDPTPEELRARRLREIRGLRRQAGRYRICMTCRELFETAPPSPSQPLQRCLCDRERHRDEWTTDLAERVHLCECCRLELLPSGSRFSVWFCPECAGWVRELNARVGRYAIPIGRHSFMARIGVPGRVLVDANPEELSAIAETLRVNALGWIDSMHHLDAFARERVTYLARRVALDHLDAIPLDTFFERLDRIEDAETGKEGAFGSLTRWFAERPAPEPRSHTEAS